MLSRNGIAPYRELTFLVHRANVKSVHSTHRVYASQQQSYFLIVFICEHTYSTSVVDLVNSLISWHRAYVCAQSPVSAGAPVGQRTTSGGNTCADTPNLSFYGHIGGLGCSARKKSKIFGTFCTTFFYSVLMVSITL